MEIKPTKIHHFLKEYTMETLESGISLSEKRQTIDILAYVVGYDLENPDPEAYKYAHAIMDVGYFEDKVIHGECSLQASKDFDPVKFEEKLDSDIEYFHNIIN